MEQRERDREKERSKWHFRPSRSWTGMTMVWCVCAFGLALSVCRVVTEWVERLLGWPGLEDSRC